jgi:hypothetical protein
LLTRRWTGCRSGTVATSHNLRCVVMTANGHEGAVGADAAVQDEAHERSPFRPTRITEGYPYDKADEAVIERVLSAVRERAAESNGTTGR